VSLGRRRASRGLQGVNLEKMKSPKKCFGWPPSGRTSSSQSMLHSLLTMIKLVPKVSRKAQILVDAAASGRGNLFMMSRASGMKLGRA
jgi:hypothetical protein